MQLMLGVVDFGRGALEIDEPRAHGYRDLIQIAHLAQNIVRDCAQGKKAPLVHRGALMTTVWTNMADAMQSLYGVGSSEPSIATTGERVE